MEEWRPVVGYEGWYEVSNCGRVRRVMRDPQRPHAALPRLLKPGGGANHYANVVLFRDGEPHCFPVHILVASAFLADRPDGYQVNHKNGAKRDNRAENLEYLTASANVKHAYDVLGRISPRGEDHGAAKATNAEVVAARHLMAAGVLQKDVAEMFGRSTAWASLVANGKTRVCD